VRTFSLSLAFAGSLVPALSFLWPSPSLAQAPAPLSAGDLAHTLSDEWEDHYWDTEVFGYGSLDAFRQVVGTTDMKIFDKFNEAGSVWQIENLTAVKVLDPSPAPDVVRPGSLKPYHDVRYHAVKVNVTAIHCLKIPSLAKRSSRRVPCDPTSSYLLQTKPVNGPAPGLRRIAKSLFQGPDELQRLAKPSAQVIGASADGKVVGQTGDQPEGR
jgi:hypothetical protein